MIAAQIPHRVGQVAACVLVILVLPMVTPGVASDSSNEAWAALVKGGHVALIRHGNAPPGYGGDPPGFRFDDCKTQRNLDDIGRGQARALGEAFRKRRVRVDRIASSPVCRCMETGQLMAVGSVEPSRALLPDMGSSAIRVLELEEMVSAWRGPGTLVLVTHALTVGRLTGFSLEQAETLVLQPIPEKPPVGHLPRGGSLVGRIAPPQ
jgi:phosphohistidine phosphatase SixA